MSADLTLQRQIGKQLRAARVVAGMTINDVAARVGVCSAMISATECGRRNSCLQTLDRLTKAIGAKVVILDCDQVEKSRQDVPKPDPETPWWLQF